MTTTYGELIDELQEAGFSEGQAKIIAKLQTTAIQYEHGKIEHDYDLKMSGNNKDLELLELSLKRDIKELELKITNQTEIIRAELKRDVAEIKASLIFWVVVVIVLQISVTAGLIFKMTGAGF